MKQFPSPIIDPQHLETSRVRSRCEITQDGLSLLYRCGERHVLGRTDSEFHCDLSQCGAEALSEYMCRELGADTRPGIVVAFATAGDLLQWNVHLHVLASDNAFSGDRTFIPWRPGTQKR